MRSLRMCRRDPRIQKTRPYCFEEIETKLSEEQDSICHRNQYSDGILSIASYAHQTIPNTPPSLLANREYILLPIPDMLG